jgi:hypothetical protein
VDDERDPSLLEIDVIRGRCDTPTFFAPRQINDQTASGTPPPEETAHGKSSQQCQNAGDLMVGLIRGRFRGPEDEILGSRRSTMEADRRQTLAPFDA